MSRTAVVVGGTGLVGRHLVSLLAQDPGVERVTAPIRRRADLFANLGVHAPVVDFDDLDRHAPSLVGSQLFVCLGTTMKKAGSKEAFRHVDLDMVVATARCAVAQGAEDVFLVSSIGADPASRSFYLRVKGEAEQAVAKIAPRSLQVFRPSLLTGARSDFRPGEKLGAFFASLASPFMRGALHRYRPIPAAVVARAMAKVARAPEPGFHVHESEEIAALADWGRRAGASRVP